MAWRGDYGAWPEYVPVAKKIANAKKAAEKLRKKGVDIQPVELPGRKIASSFWGKAWCDHMESYHDFENRLPRGRSYVRNGSVVHLEVTKGLVKALVAGSETYTVEIKVDLLPRPDWERMKKQCVGQIASLLDLLKGKLSDGVMRIVTNRDNGLFPGPDEFRMGCSCPDSAYMCKHIAAALYGVGARLDNLPELLFLLRGIDHTALAADGGVDAVIAKGGADGDQLGGADLSEMFGIELLSSDAASNPSEVAASNPGTKPSRKAKAAAAAKPKTLRKTKGCLTVDEKVIPAPLAKQTDKSMKAKAAPATQQKSAKTDVVKSVTVKTAKPKKKATKTPSGRKTASARKNKPERLDNVLKMVEEYTASKKREKQSKGKRGAALS